MWRAPDGARLRFAYLERDADADMYQGHNYTRVYVEEFPEPRPGDEIDGDAARRRGRAGRFACHRKSTGTRAPMGQGPLH